MGISYDGTSLTIDLPALVGSDKQVAWASDIRDGAIRGYFEGIKGRIATIEAANAGLAKMAEALSVKTDAKLWIDAAQKVEACVYSNVGDGTRIINAIR